MQPPLVRQGRHACVLDDSSQLWQLVLDQENLEERIRAELELPDCCRLRHLLEQWLMFQHNDVSLAVNTYPGDILSTKTRTDPRRYAPTETQGWYRGYVQ